MAIQKEILEIIEAEQYRQGGLFLPSDSDSYLAKISLHAELITHQEGESCLGFCFFYCNAEDKQASYITLIGTSRAARGKGVGYGLLQHVLAVTRQRGFSSCQLEVRKANHEAFLFYQKAGFSILEDRGEKYLMEISAR